MRRIVTCDSQQPTRTSSREDRGSDACFGLHSHQATMWLTLIDSSAPVRRAE